MYTRPAEASTSRPHNDWLDPQLLGEPVIQPTGLVVGSSSDLSIVLGSTGVNDAGGSSRHGNDIDSEIGA